MLERSPVLVFWMGPSHASTALLTIPGGKPHASRLSPRAPSVKIIPWQRVTLCLSRSYPRSELISYYTSKRRFYWSVQTHVRVSTMHRFCDSTNNVLQNEQLADACGLLTQAMGTDLRHKRDSVHRRGHPLRSVSVQYFSRVVGPPVLSRAANFGEGVPP